MRFTLLLMLLIVLAVLLGQMDIINPGFGGEDL